MASPASLPITNADRIFRPTEVLGTIDYIDTTDGTVVFRTCPDERGKVVLQIGTASAERAVAVGQMVGSRVRCVWTCFLAYLNLLPPTADAKRCGRH